VRVFVTGGAGFVGSHLAEVLLERTALFADMQPLLLTLERRSLAWGVVTNKATRFTEPVLRGLALDQRAAVVICGDTTAHAKPHPEPLLEAARRHLQGQKAFDLDLTLRQWERGYIDAALALTHGNLTRAAKLLGITFRAMRYRMERLGIK